ncbi:MAG: AsmA family protein [Betaproteobacteria bacterium]|nr:MAG: AsmA family protein [Betaproteobacteria bacterium]
MDSTTRSRLRKTWPWLAGLAVIIAALAACEWQGWPFLKRPIERSLTQRMQRPVEFGDRFAMHVLGALRVDTDALRIGPPSWSQGASAPDLLRARDAQLVVPYSTLLQLRRADSQQPIHITTLKVGSADANLQRYADGRANWHLMPAQAAASAPAQDPQLPRIDELVITTGRIALRDEVLKALGEATVSTTEGEHAAVKAAGLKIDGNGRYSDQPFEFHITSRGALPLLVPPAAASAVPITVHVNAGKSRFSFDGTGTDILDVKALDGAMVLSGPSLAKVGDSLGITLPTTEPFVLKGRIAKSGEQWSLDKAELNVGDSRLGGRFNFDRRPKVPMLSGELNGSRFVLADLLPAFGVPAPGTGNPAPPPGRVLPQREFDIPSLHAMNASVKLRFKRAELGTLFARPLEPLDGDLSLRDGVLNISELVAHTAGGEMRGALGLDARTTPAAWSSDLRLSAIELEQWLRPRDKASQERKPTTGEKPGYVSGRLGGHVQLRGKGNSIEKVARTLDGSAQLWVNNGTISHLVVEAIGIDVAQGLGVLVKGDDRLPMSCAIVQGKVTHGLLTPDVAIIDTTDSTVLGSGQISLADERLDLKITAKPKDVSPLTLRTPVKIEGTFAAPKVKLEPKPLGRKLAAAAALAIVNPLAGLIPLIDFGDRDPQACARTLQGLRGAPAEAKGKAVEAGPTRHAAAAASAPVRR